jgi:glycosyltransferase involved in cell wall biosynthesis
VFAYSYAAGSIFRMAKSLGLTTVLGQIDPGPVEDEIVADLYRDAGQLGRYERIPAVYWARWQEEIALSDVVVANSEWSKRALMRVGVSETRISVVPLAYDAPLSAQLSAGTRPPTRSFTLDDPLKLLFLGQVTFRKGIGPLLEAIQRMPTAPIRLDIVGDVQIDVPPAVKADARVMLHGPAQRSEVHRYYAGADLFVFPTLSDGFGMTQLEAMAHGLPILTSRYCGSVVEHGVNGFVLEEVTPDAIRAVLEHILTDPCRVSTWRDNARIPKAFSKEALAANLLGLRIDR